MNIPYDVYLQAQEAAEAADGILVERLAAYEVVAEWARKEALIEAAALARDMVDNEADGYYGQACYEVARAIGSLGAGLNYQPSPDSEPRG